MASPTAKAWKDCQKIEKKLQGSIADAQCDNNHVNRLLSEYRASCDKVVFMDWDSATDVNLELKLWESHSKVNNRFRKQLSSFRDGGGKKKIVEQRKLMKQYLEFIKSSQRYYRAYIQRLATSFGGILELEAVAHKFGLNSLQNETLGEFSDELRYNVLISCHQTLIRLGDLSRYRETELVTKERNWGPAIGYYDLAGAIRPSSGASHSQLAVIAQADRNHLRAMYHLYRALAVDEPHPTAKNNLELEFKKIVTAWEKGDLMQNGPQQDVHEPGKALLGWFLLLHARCYKGVEFTEHDELETEMLSQLVIDLKERSLEGTLHKLVLINIAAEYFAGIRFQASPEHEENMHAFFFFQRLNVKTMSTLLQIVQPEFENVVEVDGDEGCRNTKSYERITIIARRALPALRLYSSWLISNTSFLLSPMTNASLNVEIKELWKSYANTLTLVAATFPVDELISVEYLLEEDEDTLGFKPLVNDNTHWRYFVPGSGIQKLKFHDNGVERHHPNKEMLGRIHDILTDGLQLALDPEVPIDLIRETTNFSYREEGLPSELLASPKSRGFKHGIGREDLLDIQDKPANDATSLHDGQTSKSAAQSVCANVDMKEMVDKITGSESNDSERLFVDDSPIRAPPTPPSHSFEELSVRDVGNDTSYGLFGTATARELVHRLDSNMGATPPKQSSLTGTPRPILPSIFNSPFAPQPDEVYSRPGTAKGLPSPKLMVSRQQPESSISSMQDPSSMFQSNTPQYDYSNGFFQPRPFGNANHDAQGSPSLVNSYGNAFGDSPFGRGTTSSGFAKRHPFPVQTPPNGQGGG